MIPSNQIKDYWIK
uniref:Uncharacterized protein n=1 Tax=Anguilla anguilla TaxID=7936 RepID=A0A0E9S8E3_ANGAN